MRKTLKYGLLLAFVMLFSACLASGTMARLLLEELLC